MPVASARDYHSISLLLQCELHYVDLPDAEIVGAAGEVVAVGVVGFFGGQLDGSLARSGEVVGPGFERAGVVRLQGVLAHEAKAGGLGVAANDRRPRQLAAGEDFL